MNDACCPAMLACLPPVFSPLSLNLGSHTSHQYRVGKVHVLLVYTFLPALTKFPTCSLFFHHSVIPYAPSLASNPFFEISHRQLKDWASGRGRHPYSSLHFATENWVTRIRIHAARDMDVAKSLCVLSPHSSREFCNSTVRREGHSHYSTSFHFSTAVDNIHSWSRANRLKSVSSYCF